MNPARTVPWSRLRTVLPWFVTVALLAYMLRPYGNADGRTELVAAYARPPAWAVIFPVLGACGAFFADSLATFLALYWAAARLRYRELVIIRGVTYFLAIVNYNLGQAALVVALTKRGIAMTRATGLILFTMGINVIVLLACTSISLATGAPAPPILRTVLWAAAASLPVYAGLLLLKPTFFATRALLTPLFELGIAGHLKAYLIVSRPKSRQWARARRAMDKIIRLSILPPLGQPQSIEFGSDCSAFQNENARRLAL